MLTVFSHSASNNSYDSREMSYFFLSKKDKKSFLCTYHGKRLDPQISHAKRSYGHSELFCTSSLSPLLTFTGGAQPQGRDRLECGELSQSLGYSMLQENKFLFRPWLSTTLTMLDFGCEDGSKGLTQWLSR